MSCPICLCPPTAPLRTDCGHVFCQSCALPHFLRHTDESAAASGQKCACPVCRYMIKKLSSDSPRVASLSYRGILFQIPVPETGSVHKHVAEEFELLPDTTKLLHKKLLDADGVRECVSQGSVMALMGTRRATGCGRPPVGKI